MEVNLGMAEAQARVVPTWLFRNLATWLPGQSALARGYRKRAVPQLRALTRRWQRLTSGRVGLWASRVPPRRFERLMSRLLALVVRQCNAHVLVLDIDRPHGQILHWMPALDSRASAYNAVLERVVEMTGGRARLVRTSTEVLADPEQLLPDGLHRSARGHELVGRRLAAEICHLGADHHWWVRLAET